VDALSDLREGVHVSTPRDRTFRALRVHGVDEELRVVSTLS
jgi:hypothetical protein